MTAPVGERRRGRWQVVVAIGAVCATPVLVHSVFYVAHGASYAGVCGPHAPDIPAHPCTLEGYRAEFGAGFAGLGLLLVEALSFVLAAGVAVVGWAVRSRRTGGHLSSRAP